MTLHGPAHPDAFRVQVGRYGERHYFDPLPACDIAPATTDRWPAITTIKKAADRDWSWTSLERAAVYLVDKRGELDGMNASEIHSRLLEVNKSGLKRAGDRGTSIHSLIEARAKGQQMLEVVPEAEPYIPTVDAFLSDHQPEWLVSEAVIINRVVGYGGTCDAILIIGGRVYLVDWKTRRAGKHGAYPEEAWQGAGYRNGEYMIVEFDHQARRMPLPQIDGALIVSLCPEGYRLYPIELDPAWEAFQALTRFWRCKLPDFYGNPIVPEKATPAPVNADDVAALRQVVEWIKETSPPGFAMLAEEWPDGVPTFKDGGPTNADQCFQLAMLIERVKKDAAVPFEPQPEPEPTPEPELPPAATVTAVLDEGEVLDENEQSDLYDDVKSLVEQLPKECRIWMARLAGEANRAGAPISLRQRRTQRRYHIILGLAKMAPHGEDELLRALVALTVQDDSLTSPAMPAGAVVASLGAVEAIAFAVLCEQYAGSGLPTVVGTDGRLRVQRAA